MFGRSPRYMQLLTGAWRPKLSGMRPRTASHCVFAKKTTMLSNRDDFRHLASPDRLIVTTRSVFDETRHNLGVLVVEMRHHSRCRQMDHVGASRARFRDSTHCPTSPLEYRRPELLYHLNKASQSPTFEFWVIFSHIRRLCSDAGRLKPPDRRIRDPRRKMQL